MQTALSGRRAEMDENTISLYPSSGTYPSFRVVNSDDNPLLYLWNSSALLNIDLGGVNPGILWRTYGSPNVDWKLHFGVAGVGTVQGGLDVRDNFTTRSGVVKKVLRTTDASLNLTDAHHIVIGTRTDSGDQTFNLPTSEFRDVGRHYIFKRSGSRNVILNAGTGINIRTSSGGTGQTYTISGSGNTAELIWDGVEWAMLSRST